MPSSERITLPITLGPIVEQGPIDLAKAREESSKIFNPSNIESVLRNGEEEMKIRNEVLEVIKQDELFSDWKRRSLHLSREQIMDLTHQACRKVYQIVEDKKWSDKHSGLLMRNLELGPFALHDIAFTPVILSQGGDEQHERWASKCLNKEILGCYLQTELGHGSNVQLLETLATYDEKTQSFDIHSPTLSSTKWWIGGLGLTATHGVVQAQLIIKGKRYGPHLFFVPLRDMKTGKPFDGIVLGDIGPKAYAGYASTDNGWARFDHVKIPRSNMLNRFAKVEPDGTYNRPPSDKMSYGGMVYIRSIMIEGSGWTLSKGATIVSRYATVRRQFKSTSDPTSKQELSVINYPHLSRRLLTLLANSYGFIFTGKRMFELYLEMGEQLKKGDVSMLADIHLATSSLKAYTSRYTIDGLEECRSMCGGHGFSAYSGFTHLFPTNAPSVTYEGENWVLMQQVGRGLLKRASEMASNPKATLSGPISFLSYLFNKFSTSGSVSVDEWLKPEIFTSFLKIRTALRLQYIIGEINIEKRQFSEISFECGELAKSYGELIVSIWFAESLSTLSSKFKSQNSVDLLFKLLAIGTLTSIYRDLTPLTLLPLKRRELPGQTQAILTAESIQTLEKAIRKLIDDLLPHAVALSDAFGHDDWELASSLGKKKGDAYESLYAMAEANPINHGGIAEEGRYNFGGENVGKNVSKSWTNFIGPLLEENARRNGGKAVVGDGSKL